MNDQKFASISRWQHLITEKGNALSFSRYEIKHSILISVTFFSFLSKKFNAFNKKNIKLKKKKTCKLKSRKCEN